MIVRWQRLQAYTLNLEQVFFLKSRANNALLKPKWAVYEVAQNAGRCNKLGMSYKTPLNNKSRKQSKRATSHEESFCKVQFIRVSPKFNLSPALDTMAFLAFVLLLSAQFKLIVPMEKVQLYRFPSGSVYFGNFICNPFRYLWEEKLESSMVADRSHCALFCVNKPKCYSFNMAAYPDFKGLYRCELLATDKYRSTERFHANSSYHHYCPWVRIADRNELTASCVGLFVPF